MSCYLVALVLQQEITITPGDSDRYGRAQITSDLQQKMLRDGAVIIYTTTSDIPPNWRQAEATARSIKAGIWSDTNFLLTPENAAQHNGEFHVIEGAISHICDSKKATYLNFGEDWHSDFFMTIPAKLRRSMKARLAQYKLATASTSAVASMKKMAR
ncbi:MAG: thermonuclease family protein [Rickettsiales bacterium]